MFNPHEYLHSFVNFEATLDKLHPEDFNLSRIRRFLDLLGHDFGSLRIIHVAGTKGKGSTCAFLARILQEAGYTVGLYTSPHLHKLNERIRILSKDNLASKDNFAGAITDEELASVLGLVRPVAATIINSGGVLTFFEVLTVVALCFFVQSKVDVVVLETGLGGRLDATNALDSQVAVITPVSLDHTRILGSSLPQIAREKAGIIKNTRQKAILAPQEKEVMDVLTARCQEFGIQPAMVYPDKWQDLKTALKGKHQTVNAAVALTVVENLRKGGFKIDDEAIACGLKRVRWAGRFEVLAQKPDIIVDCAHNAASAQALAATLMEVYPFRRVFLVLGVSEDKDRAAIAMHLKDSVTHIFLTHANHPRAHVFSQQEASTYFGNKPFEIVETLPEAIQRALEKAGSQDVILITGSVFIVAEAIDWVLHAQPLE